MKFCYLITMLAAYSCYKNHNFVDLCKALIALFDRKE